MAAELSERLRDLATARDVPESEILERALERGLEELWEDHVLGRYLEGELDRDEAIERVGRATVERADRELDIVEADVEWGVNG